MTEAEANLAANVQLPSSQPQYDRPQSTALLLFQPLIVVSTMIGKTLVFSNHSTYSTVEALGVPVLPQSLNPAIGRFDGEFAAVAFGGEKFVPMRRAIRIAVLDVEARRSDGLLSKRSRHESEIKTGLRATKTDEIEDDDASKETTKARSLMAIMGYQVRLSRPFLSLRVKK